MEKVQICKPPNTDEFMMDLVEKKKKLIGEIESAEHVHTEDCFYSPEWWETVLVCEFPNSW